MVCRGTEVLQVVNLTCTWKTFRGFHPSLRAYAGIIPQIRPQVIVRCSVKLIRYGTIFLKRFIRQTVYTRCTRTNCKIVPVTNSNRYVQYGASGKGVVEIQMRITAVKKEQKKHCGFYCTIPFCTIQPEFHQLLYINHR